MHDVEGVLAPVVGDVVAFECLRTKSVAERELRMIHDTHHWQHNSTGIFNADSEALEYLDLRVISVATAVS